MRKKIVSTFLVFCLVAVAVRAQQGAATPATDSTASPIQLSFPEDAGWNSLQEGHLLEFNLHATGGTGQQYTYAIASGQQEGMVFDSTGHFAWTPGHDFADRLTPSRTAEVVFRVTNEKNESGTQAVPFKVAHVNRPPQVGELKPFYVQYNKPNAYQIDASAVHDEDGDPIVFIPIVDQMPEGAKLSSGGEFSWKPSLSQFNAVKNKPLYIEFYAEDQPSKSRTKGRFKVEATSLDLPPTVSVVPGGNAVRYPENATVNLKFYLVDPNGDDDIASFGFVSDNPNVPKTALVKNAPTQYEFIWNPGYEFVRDPLDSVAFNVSFFVIDKAQKRDEIKIRFAITNTINEAEKDQQLYSQYRTALVRAWDLLEQLKESEEKLKRDYRRARRGKKGRSVLNASLGAVSGLAPVTIQAPTTAKMVSTIGGTSVMTLGTLEATEVIGKSTKDLVERLNYIMDKKNELQLKGDIFARKYTLKSQRRRPEFIKELDEFVALMNLKGLVALELNAGWQNKNKATDSQIQRTFKDFNPDAG
jgi:hypothetical protein